MGRQLVIRIDGEAQPPGVLDAFQVAHRIAVEDAEVDAFSHLAGEPLQLRADRQRRGRRLQGRSEEHTSELQSLMRISYAVFCLKKKTQITSNLVDVLHPIHKTQSYKKHI